MHPSNPQNNSYSIYPTNLTEPFFHPYQILHHTNQTPIIHCNTHTDLHHQIITTYSNIAHPHPHLHPYSYFKLQPIYHATYHSNQLKNLSQIPHTNLHLPWGPSQASHTHQQRKPTLINITQLPKHPSHKTCHKYNHNFSTDITKPTPWNPKT